MIHLQRTQHCYEPQHIEKKFIHSFKEKKIHNFNQRKKNSQAFNQLNQLNQLIHSTIQSFIQAFNQTIQTFKNLKNRYPLEKGQKRPKKGYPPKTPKNPILTDFEPF